MSQVLAIQSAPEFSIVSAYRPILFTIRVTDTAPPRVVYCDVYVNNVYYRTIPKTQYKTLNPGSSDWEFDIQVPCQEVLEKYLPTYAGTNVILARPCTAQVFCKFRGSTIDADGFLVPAPTVPVQGTGTTDPISGSGLLSGTLWVLNVALQHQHTQNLPSHLEAYENGTWDVNAYPMSHRQNNYLVGLTDNDYYALFYIGAGTISKLKLYYRNKGSDTVLNATQTITLVDSGDAPVGDDGFFYLIVNNGDGTQTVTFYFPTAGVVSVDLRYFDGSTHSFAGAATSPRSITIPVGSYTYSMLLHTADGDVLVDADVGLTQITTTPTSASKGLYFIPNGPKNLAALFGSVTWRNVKDYYVEVLDDSDAVIGTSTLNKMQDWVNADNARLYFLNDCGTYDSLNFQKPKGTTETSSSEFQRNVGTPLIKSDFSIARNAPRSNETKEVKRLSLETEQDWLKECFRSPEAYEDWPGIEGQNAGYMSVVILNGKFDSLKNFQDYQYEFVIQYKQSNEGFSIRN